MKKPLKKVLTAKDFEEACKRADISMKLSKGHQYETILKTRCVWCRRSPRQDGKCRSWFRTFMAHLSYELTGTYNFDL